MNKSFAKAGVLSNSTALNLREERRASYKPPPGDGNVAQGLRGDQMMAAEAGLNEDDLLAVEIQVI